MVVIIVGSFWQIRVLAMGIMVAGVVVVGVPLVLVVVGVIGVVDSMVISEISLERHVGVVVVVVAGVGSDGGLKVNTGGSRRADRCPGKPEVSGQEACGKVTVGPAAWALFKTPPICSWILRASRYMNIFIFIFSDRTKSCRTGPLILSYCPDIQIHNPDPRRQQMARPLN